MGKTVRYWQEKGCARGYPGIASQAEKGTGRDLRRPVKSRVLYGSYARGEAHPASDVDVMIVLSDYQSYGKEIDRTGELVSKLSLEYGLSIRRVITKEIQWQKAATPLLRNIRAEGIAA